jgi:RNA polymerase sigma-70 factor, ECF subfamily
MDDTATDEALVRKVQRGDDRAFEALVRRHLRAAYTVALDGTGDADDAEDVCQEAFLAALQRIRELREPASFRAWLVTIVRNRAHNVRRSRSAHPTVSLAEEVAAVGGGGLERVERRELRDRLGRAVQALTSMQRRVLLLHDYEGWRHGEIAALLGISAGASRFHLHVARRAMRRRLADLNPVEARQ